MPRPQLTFFCELPPEPLARLFDGRFVIDDLKALGATLSLGILDLSVARTELVKRLNKAGVPVVAWLLLPEEDGYWFNLDNQPQATTRYVDFKAWTTQHDLQWSGVGLDIEMDINDLRIALCGEADRTFARRLWRRFLDKPRVARATQSYQTLVDSIRADGYPVESYQLPLITDERRAHSTVLQRTMGLVDLASDREVLMLYTSLLTDHGDAVLWSYAPEADAVGVGITGGGVDLSEELAMSPLTWDQFARDLRLCVMQNKPVHIFSLEGCVEQDFLARLNTFDWDQPTSVPANLGQVRGIRTGVAALLWMIERPWAVLLGLATLVWLGVLFKQTEDKRRKRDH